MLRREGWRRRVPAVVRTGRPGACTRMIPRWSVDMTHRNDFARGQKTKPTTPSFVFILADDLGYADLHCYGGREDCSPHLDRMAADGARFTNGYANSSVCSPSRFAIAT